MVQLVVVRAPSSKHVKNPVVDQTTVVEWGRMFYFISWMPCGPITSSVTGPTIQLQTIYRGFERNRPDLSCTCTFLFLRLPYKG
ncbi:hypothetical protein V6N13_132563 [Hibiscus sabdariffa]|uniref:Uncharacterized protein n=1 Tax=Hibiscus sabdariffa TaxID=183260 RepID=A0ABR2PVM6_9ROSI